MPKEDIESLPEALDALSTEIESPAPPWWVGLTAPSVYCAHPDTMELVGTTLADPSPLEPNVWITPAHAYLDEPPAAVPNKAIVRQSGAWAVVEDHRGATVYSTTDGSPTLWSSLGALPSTVTLVAPGKFDEWKDGEWHVDEAAKNASAREAATNRRTLLMQFAGTQIGALQDAVDLEIAQDKEVALLKAWKTYRVQLNRIDLTAAIPDAVQWPASPDDSSVNAWLAAQGIDIEQGAKAAAS